MRRRPLASALAMVLCAIALITGHSALRSVRTQLAAARVCEAVEGERWEEALALATGSADDPTSEPAAAECRCWALLATGRETDCVALLDLWLSRLDGEAWTPHPALARILIRARRDRGETDSAATLARRATARYPDDRDLLQLELMTRSMVEGEEAVLADMRGRLGSGAGASIPLRLVLSHGLHRRGDFEEALEVLGDRPPAAGDPDLADWFEARARALASQGRLDAVARSYDQWIEKGGDPDEVRARHALRLSQSGLVDPARPIIDLLRNALATEDRIPSESIREALHHRLIGHLLASGRTEEALEAYDAARKRFELRGLERDQIARSAALAEAAARGEGDPVGGITFHAPRGEGNGRLLVSPDPGEPPDAPYVSLPLDPARPLEVTRRLSVLPQRWVYVDAKSRTLASGTVWPLAGRTVEVRIEPGVPRVATPFVPEPRPADGRRRVFVVLPDCADWRLVGYLRARGELPLMAHLLETGFRAVLESTPPLTAAAMESLVWPTRSEEVSFVALAHRLGVELAGLASIGRNPLGFLSPLLPESRDLFETIGEGEVLTANMLFAHGGIEAGRHAEIVGPRGERRRAASMRSLRPLTAEETERFPPLASDPAFLPLVEGIAAQLDDAVTLARAGEVDLLLLRLESLDILTHAHFHALTRTGQDHGDAFLLWVYRYIDWRLAELSNALDGDDVLIVMSDHGIRTPMEHATDALFVATGSGVPRGRADGTPHLRGVARVIAELFGIDTRWPDTGVAPWAAAASDATVLAEPSRAGR